MNRRSLFKYALFLLFGLSALGGIGFALYSLLMTDITQQGSPTPIQRDAFPVIGDAPVIAGQTMTVTLKDGALMQVYDIQQKDESQRISLDTAGQDYFILTDTSNDPGYVIAYFAKDSVFNITLTAEPFAATQKIAEGVLQRRLHLSIADMCKLQVVVSGVRKSVTISESTSLSYCTNI